MSKSVISADTEWCSRPADEIAWAVIDNDFIAYHRPSGKTHFLNSASYRLLTEILDEPAGIDKISNAFAPEPAKDQIRREYVAEMRALVEHLEHLGLVERV